MQPGRRASSNLCQDVQDTQLKICLDRDDCSSDIDANGRFDVPVIGVRVTGHEAARGCTKGELGGAATTARDRAALVDTIKWSLEGISGTHERMQVTSEGRRRTSRMHVADCGDCMFFGRLCGETRSECTWLPSL